MSELRERMIQDLKLAELEEGTMEVYLRASSFGDSCNTSYHEGFTKSATTDCGTTRNEA